MRCFLLVVICLHSLDGYSQIKKETIETTYNKNTYLFFPGNIDFVDVGSEDILASFEKNMVVISSAIDHHDQTSLFVTTTNQGRFFFLVSYNEDPNQYIYNYESVVVAGSPVLVGKPGEKETVEDLDSIYIFNQFNKVPEGNKLEIINSIDVIARDQTRVFDVGISKKKLMFKARGVYYDGDYVYLSLELFNYSQIDYELDFVKFFMINNKGAGKRTFQEDELLPVVTYKPYTKAGSDEAINIIYGFKKFTMTDKKLKIDIWEHRGDRRLEITISENDILKAKTISELD